MMRGRKRTFRRQVQTQYGPEVQEMGGFWPSAASALANWAAPGRGSLDDAKTGSTCVNARESATV